MATLTFSFNTPVTEQEVQTIIKIAPLGSMTVVKDDRLTVEVRHPDAHVLNELGEWVYRRGWETS